MVLCLHLSWCNISKTVTEQLLSVSPSPSAASNTSGTLSSSGGRCTAPQLADWIGYVSPSLGRDRIDAESSLVYGCVEAVGQELLCGLSSIVFVRKNIQKRCRCFYVTDENSVTFPTFSPARKSNVALAVKARALVLWRWCVFALWLRSRGVGMCRDSVLSGLGDGINKQHCICSNCCTMRQDKNVALFLSA